MIKKWLEDIRVKTADMNRQETCAYIITYYWYHILISVSVIALIFMFAAHYIGNKETLFTCVMVNQAENTERDELLKETFSEKSGLPQDQIVVDSGYMFSFGDVRFSEVNESSYEKFFLQWRNQELDAVILSESFYQHCKEMGGRFRNLQEMDTEGLECYTDDGQKTAIFLGKDSFSEKALGDSDEKLLLAFPSSGKHEEECQTFIDYLKAVKAGEIGGMSFEKIIN
ncbi:MAG: hypothetical protein Q4F21_04080 [Lachnospiraceae bacterium]|nr:hypothetical protein [Lachnospiraceae bacterium]